MYHEGSRKTIDALLYPVKNHYLTPAAQETPLFGRVLSFGSRELFTKWMAALLVAEYGTDIVHNNLVVLE